MWNYPKFRWATIWNGTSVRTERKQDLPMGSSAAAAFSSFHEAIPYPKIIPDPEVFSTPDNFQSEYDSMEIASSLKVVCVSVRIAR